MNEFTMVPALMNSELFLCEPPCLLLVLTILAPFAVEIWRGREKSEWQLEQSL